MKDLSASTILQDVAVKGSNVAGEHAPEHALAHSSWSERVRVAIEVMLPQLNLGCDRRELTLPGETMGASSCPIPV